MPAAWAQACPSRFSPIWRRRLDSLARKTSLLSIRPPRSTRFGSPLVLSRVHWVEPKLVAEITYLTWTADNLLRHTVYVGLREDKPADQVLRVALGMVAREKPGPPMTLANMRKNGAHSVIAGYQACGHKADV